MPDNDLSRMPDNDLGHVPVGVGMPINLPVPPGPEAAVPGGIALPGIGTERAQVDGVQPSVVSGEVNGADTGARPLTGERVKSSIPVDITQCSVSGQTLAERVGREIKSCQTQFGSGSAAEWALADQWHAIRRASDLLSNGPMLGRDLLDQRENLAIAATGLNETMARCGHAIPKSLYPEMEAVTKNLEQQIKERLAYIGQSIEESPLSVAKMYKGKAQICLAAIDVLQNEMNRLKATGPIEVVEPKLEKLRAARTNLERRVEQLETDADTRKGQTARPKDILGRKPLSWVKDPRTRWAQGNARDSLVDKLGKTGAIASDTPEVDEQTIIQAYLAKTLDDAGALKHDGVLGAVKNARDKLFSKAEHHVAHEFHVAMNKQLNSQKWKPIGDDIRLNVGTETISARSEIKPAAEFFSSYQGCGFNSHSTTEYQHAVNLAQSTLLDGEGVKKFSGMRHGVLSAYGINPSNIRKMPDTELDEMIRRLLPERVFVGKMSAADKCDAVRNSPKLVDAMRRRANINRATEVVAAHVIADDKLRADALAGKTVTLDILSLSLLTPDHIRSHPDSNEQQMLADQAQAWKDVTGLRTITIADEAGKMVEVRVDVRPLAANFGVNEGALKYGSGKHSVISGWADVAGMNNHAIEALLGPDSAGLAKGIRPGGLIGERMEALAENVRVAQNRLNVMLATPNPDAAMRTNIANETAQIKADLEKLSMANGLVRQIGEIHRDESFRTAGNEPYKLPTRLAVLADMFGVKVAWNCKSGKDRTGELDAEIKHMRMQMDLHKQVPHYARERTQEEKDQFFEVVTNSGNFAMQRMNTGWAGFKLGGVPELFEQFGGKKGDARTEVFVGSSDKTAA